MNKPTESFDLFAAPDEDHLQEQLAQGNFQWTNKFTKFLMVLVLLVGTLSVGAWYGHRTATAAGVTANGAPGARASFGNRGGTGALPSFGGTGGGGGFNRGTPGTVSKVTGNKVEIMLPDSPTFKVGDTITVRALTGGFGGSAPGAAPTIPSTTNKSSGKNSTTTKGSTTSTKPSVGGGNGGAPGGGGGRGGFNNPEMTACLKEQGVVIADGARPDRNDPKVATALQTCFAKLGGAPGGFGGRAGAPGAPGAAPTPAPNN